MIKPFVGISQDYRPPCTQLLLPGLCWGHLEAGSWQCLPYVVKQVDLSAFLLQSQESDGKKKTKNLDLDVFEDPDPLLLDIKELMVLVGFLSG